jgi:Flp pilus assembly protein TadD
MRGGEQETDPATLQLEGEVQKVLERHGNSAKTLHALGVAHLLNAALEKGEPQSSEEQRQADAKHVALERAQAVQDLRAAALAAPDNAEYQSDLAAALIATEAEANLNLAVTACNQAINIDSRSREALFNRAIALRNLRDERATAAFRSYLKVDPSSPWAEEAKQQIDLLK